MLKFECWPDVCCLLLFVEIGNNMHRNEEDSIVHECALRWCRDTFANINN